MEELLFGVEICPCRASLEKDGGVGLFIEGGGHSSHWLSG